MGAFVVGDERALTTPLFDVGHDMGFAALHPYEGLVQVKQQVERTPVCFFLCAEVINPIVLSPVLNAIRASARRRIRFAPIVYFCESPSAETVALCAALGFDDVLTTPFTPHRIAARLFRLVSQPQTYWETDTYLGPQRTAKSGTKSPTLQARDNRAYTRRYDFQRNPEAGIIMLREDVLSPSMPAIGTAA